jgi:hypothetical protein
MIRHGEKPPQNGDGGDVNGLSALGLERAQWLRQCFGENSQYNIGYILAEAPKKGSCYFAICLHGPILLTQPDGSRTRPLETITPLAADLGITPNSSIARDDAAAAAAAAKAFQGPGNVLICWEHGQLADIAEALGVPHAEYPGDRFDLIWTVPAPYTSIVSVTSEGMPGVDGGM